MAWPTMLSKQRGWHFASHFTRSKPPCPAPASLSLLNSTETTTHPNPSEANLLDSRFDHPWDHCDERSVRESALPGGAAPGIQSWQVFWDFFFSTSYICMETGFVPGSKAARVYYPQINPWLPLPTPVTVMECHVATRHGGTVGSGCQPLCV